MAGYTLSIYSPILQGVAKYKDITDIAVDWRRTIRLQGGYWLGSFQLFGPSTKYEANLRFLQDWFYQNRMGHIVETSGGGVTWEGYINEMELDDNQDNPYLNVDCAGYIFAGQDKFVSAGDSTMANASAWINSIVTTDLAEFLSVGLIRTNTLQVKQEANIDQRAWDEIIKVLKLGDASGNPWRFYVGPDRKVYYEQIDTTPRYYARGGIKRRWSRLAMWNSVGGQYTDTAGEQHEITAATNPQSIANYGTRQERLSVDYVDTDGANAYRDTYLNENAWPWARAVGSRQDIKLYNVIGAKMGIGSQAVNQWQIIPSVVRDLAYPVGGQQYLAYLSDVRDFVVDEVEASADGISLRTTLFDDADLIEAQDEYQAELARKAAEEKRRK